MSELLATQLVMMEKDKEILKLKAELARQQNSIQQTSEQNLTKQQKEFQEQIEQMIVQKEAERSALKSQVQQLKTRYLQKYYPNIFTNGPSEDQNILAIESTDTLDNYIDKIDPTFDNSSISDYTDIKQTTDNSNTGDPNESKTETTDDKMQDQTNNIDNEDQDNSEFESKEIIQTDNNTLNSPIDFNDHNTSMETQAETDNSHKESEPIESEDESDSKSFGSESIDFDIDSDVGSEHDFENLEAIRLQHKKEIRTMDFGPNLHTQVSECADINAIRSNNLTYFNCKSLITLQKIVQNLTNCNNFKATKDKTTQ